MYLSFLFLYHNHLVVLKSGGFFGLFAPSLLSIPYHFWHLLSTPIPQFCKYFDDFIFPGFLYIPTNAGVPGVLAASHASPASDPVYSGRSGSLASDPGGAGRGTPAAIRGGGGVAHLSNFFAKKGY